MATRALKASWFRKWVVNLRQRPEEIGALLQARLTDQKHHAAGRTGTAFGPTQFRRAAHHSRTIRHLPVAASIPRGGPAHPCYPTGHGIVGGACIAAIKFFFACNQPIRPLLLAAGSDVMVPSADGLSLVPYTGSDRDSLTINGELSKLAGTSPPGTAFTPASTSAAPATTRSCWASSWQSAS